MSWAASDASTAAFALHVSQSGASRSSLFCCLCRFTSPRIVDLSGEEIRIPHPRHLGGRWHVCSATIGLGRRSKWGQEDVIGRIVDARRIREAVKSCPLSSKLAARG